jgi:colanic acid biosynthesis glycosyl transferase WcaI
MIEFLRSLPFKTYIGLFLCSLFASYWLIPKISWLARGMRLYEKTRASRASENLSLGGLSTGLPFLLGISLLLLLQNQVSENMYMVPLQMRGLFFGCTAALILGLLHDVFTLNRPLRLILQFALALMAYFYGFRAEPSPTDSMPLIPIDDLLLTLLWIIGLINFFELLNRIFSIFPAFAFVVVLAILGLSFTIEQHRTIVVCCLLAGGLLGYLSHGRTARPALGSTGTYFLGFAMAVTTIQSGIIDGAVEVLATATAMGALALLLLLKLPSHLPFSGRKKTANLRIRSLHHYRLAAEARIQAATNAEEAWDALRRATGEFGWNGLRLSANNGTVVEQFPTSTSEIPVCLEIAMHLSGGQLQVLGDITPQSPADDNRRSFFYSIADEYDHWREEYIRQETTRRTAARRVLLVNRYYGGTTATGQLLEELAEDLVATGIDVTVLTGDLGYESMAVLPGRNEWANGIHIYRVPSTQFGRSSILNRMMDFVSFYLVSLTWIFKASPNDFTHILTFTDPPLIAVLGRVAQRIKRWHFIYCIQDLYPDTALALGLMREGPMFRFLHRLNRKLLLRADTVVPISKPMEDHIRALSNSQASQIRIPNWADGDKVKLWPEKDKALLAELGMADCYTIIYAGNMGLAQQVDTLIELVKRCKGINSIQFLFIGGGVKKQLIEETISAHSINNARVLAHQPKTALHRFLAIGDIGIVSLAPAMEGLAIPSKTYSYLAAGLPILSIASPHSELKDYADLDLGVHFTPESINEIVHFLSEEARNGNRFDRTSIRKIFDEHFARNRITRQYAELIQQ